MLLGSLRLKMLGFLFLCMLTNQVFSQNESNENGSLLHPKTEQFANEVYVNCPQYLGINFLEKYSQQIIRVQIFENTTSEVPEFLYLSEIPLNNKCNNLLERDDSNFDFQNFNPLKYQFNFALEIDQNFIVNNTKYIIHISSH